ncbi:MAG TPA: tRNA lysidine(34) synthetase TilS [Clostridiales bacterium]|nr:tRNA lysidine(34) synthetase TilS [Clostridiales bacterium]
MFSRVSEYIDQYKMIEKGDRIAVGVSGGADSVCLLYMLFEIGKYMDINLIVVHINHGIRGKEGSLDEDYVEGLAKALKLEYICFHEDVPAIAKVEGLSEEEAGRNVRYQSFFKVALDRNCNKIAIAHNKNDIAETVLFNLFRGTGIKGLSGILPVSKRMYGEKSYTIIRPLLCLEREEIELYLSDNVISYHIDQTNLGDDYSRNKIRNHILSYAKDEINSNAVSHIVRASLQLQEIDRYIDALADAKYHELIKEDEKGALYFDIEEFDKLDIVIQKEVIRRAMMNLAGKLKDIESKHVEEVLSLVHKQVGKMVNLPYEMIALKEYSSIRLYKEGYEELVDKGLGPFNPVTLEIPGQYYCQNIHMILEVSIIKYDKNQSVPKNSCTKWFDYDKIENTIVLRTRNKGDYIEINDSGGRKKLKDYYIDQKIPRNQRDLKLLVADGSHIMWVIGQGDRISEKYKVNDNTTNILLMKLINAEDYKK